MKKILLSRDDFEGWLQSKREVKGFLHGKTAANAKVELMRESVSIEDRVVGDGERPSTDGQPAQVKCPAWRYSTVMPLKS